MDPATLIVTALAAGTAVGVSDTASSAVKDAYSALKALVRERLRGKPGAEDALARYEHAPGTWGAPLAAELGRAGADRDPQLLMAAQRLMHLVDEAGARAGKYAVELPGAQGVQIGDRNTQHNVFQVPPDRLMAGAAGVQAGERNTQIIYSYNSLTWTDGVAAVPLAGVSGAIDSPYRGLSAFDERDGPFFFGREAAATQVLARMARLADSGGILMLSGVSGAGKSSLLQAGVLPRLRGTGLASAPGSASWPCLIFTPSHAPLDELAVRVSSLAGMDAAGVRRGLHADPAGFALAARQAALSRPGMPGGPGSGSPRLLLVIDQFEQLFTQCSADEDREAFVTALHAAAAGDGRGGIPAAMVVLSVRADFEARCAEYPELAEAVQDRFLLTAMTARQLRMAITEPAKIAGSSVDEDLVDLLLREMSSRQQ